jgi:hypothetical protein
MFHQEPPQNEVRSLSREDVERILSEGVSECKKIMCSMIEQRLPLNEAPSFFYTVTSFLPKEFNAVITREEQDDMTQQIRSVLKGKSDPILSAMCLRSVGGLTQFVVSLFCPSGDIYALVITPPSLKEGIYRFAKPTPLSQPKVALSFLTDEEIYH